MTKVIKRDIPKSRNLRYREKNNRKREEITKTDMLVRQHKAKFINYRDTISDKMTNVILYVSAFRAALVKAENEMQSFFQTNDEIKLMDEKETEQLELDMSLFIRLFFAREFNVSILNLSLDKALDQASTYVLESNSSKSKTSLVKSLLKKEGSKPSDDMSALVGLVKNLSKTNNAEPPFGRLK